MEHKEVVNQHITLRNKSSLSLLDISVLVALGMAFISLKSQKLD